jgi:arylsulfatase A
MKNKKTGFYFGLGIASLAPLALAGESTGNQIDKPNVVFIMVDDLGWADVGCYGNPFYETPNIDRFASEGVLFTNAYAASHVCSPTRASFLTGKYPATINLTDWLPGRRDNPHQRLKNADIVQHMSYEEITIAEALKEQGYATALYGKWHLGENPYNPKAYGFDIYTPKWAKGWPASGYHAPFGMEGIEGKIGDYLTDRLTDESLKFIETNKDQPFFLYLSFFTVHDPIQGRADLVSKYEKKLKQMPPQEGPPYILEGNPDATDPVSPQDAQALLELPEYQGFSQLPNQMVKIKQHQDNVQFAAMVECMDENVGRVLDKLKELGLDDNTIVIFFSDNGGMSAANFFRPDRVITERQLDIAFATPSLPLRGAKGWLYEGGIRVPMIVRWSGCTKKGTESDVPVISVDFYPTIMDMLGLQVPAGQNVDGVSIVPLLKGEKILDREAIYWHFPQYSNHGFQSPGGAIRKGDYKLLEYFENNTVQLFNLREDIGEQHDISSSNPEMVIELLTMLHQWREKVDAQMPKPNPDYVGGLSPVDRHPAPGIVLFPNPATDEFVVLSEEMINFIELAGYNGRVVYNREVNGRKVRVPTGGLQDGSYIVHIHTNSGVYFKKVVIIR